MGGTVDPQTGQIVWQMHVPLAAQLAHYRAHPPCAIRALRATPVDVEWQFDGHGEPVNVCFELACPCGGTRFVPTCGRAADGSSCPLITLECESCAAEYDVFDASRDGYEGELGDPELLEPVAFDELLAPDVDPPHEIVVRFEFPSEHLGDPEWRDREPELFSWFTLLARDPATKRLAFLFDAECA